MKRILNQASKLVTPSKRENEKLSQVEEKVRKLIGSPKDVLSVIVGGSYAKGTWLKGEADIDFFLQYPQDCPREKLEGEAIQHLLRAVKGYEVNMRYAEHPYVEAFVDGTRVNLVPCYKVERGKWRSAVDRSPFHSEYIQSKFDERLRLETRLLKKFVKCASVYGAEIKIRGFSGYVCEVLTLTCGSFEGVLEALSNLKKRGEIISVEPYDRQVVSLFSSPVVILDPIDTMRNLGTAISEENLGKFILRARAFLAKPSISYFAKRENNRVQDSRELLRHVVIVSFHNKARSVDILWGELRKSVSSLATKLKSLGFNVLREQAASNEKGESAFVFLLLDRDISALLVRPGPDVYRKEDLERYIEANRRKYILSWIDSEGKVQSLFQRETTDATSALRKLLSDAKQVQRLGFSKAIIKEISNGFDLREGASIGKSENWLKESVHSIVTSEKEFFE